MKSLKLPIKYYVELSYNPWIQTCFFFFYLQFMNAKFVHTRDGLPMISSEATLAKFSSQNGYELKAEMTSVFEVLNSAKVTLDLSRDLELQQGEIDLKIEWNNDNKHGAKLAYEVRTIFICFLLK